MKGFQLNYGCTAPISSIRGHTNLKCWSRICLDLLFSPSHPNTHFILGRLIQHKQLFPITYFIFKTVDVVVVKPRLIQDPCALDSNFLASYDIQSKVFRCIVLVQVIKKKKLFTSIVFLHFNILQGVDCNSTVKRSGLDHDKLSNAHAVLRYQYLNKCG